MNSAPATPTPFWRPLLLPANLFAAAAVIGVVFVLFGRFPYASGYGATRVHMFEFMSYVWKRPEWEHCWLVPLAVIGLVSYRRKELAAHIEKLGIEEIVFAVRQADTDGHWYANFGYHIVDADRRTYYHDGGRLCRLDLKTGQVAVLEALQHAPGLTFALVGLAFSLLGVRPSGFEHSVSRRTLAQRLHISVAHHVSDHHALRRGPEQRVLVQAMPDALRGRSETCDVHVGPVDEGGSHCHACPKLLITATGQQPIAKSMFTARALQRTDDMISNIQLIMAHTLLKPQDDHISKGGERGSVTLEARGGHAGDIRLQRKRRTNGIVAAR